MKMTYKLIVDSKNPPVGKSYYNIISIYLTILTRKSNV